MAQPSRILHLADLHLGDKGEQELGDYKFDIVEPAHRQDRERMLRTTLARIGQDLEKRKERLDAVVMTGDFTTAYDERGFKVFPELLDELPEAVRPPPECVVAMPGNHDVKRGSEPSSEERYALFVEHIKKRGYVCPILEGCEQDGESHLLVDEEAGWVIVPINSANWSQRLVDPPVDPKLWSAFAAQVREDADEDALERFESLRLHDAARVDGSQLEKLRDELEALDNPDLVRIAALHHHLLPVSFHEEVKTFESIMDLGLLRGFFRDNNIRLVLHGHKHTSHIYWDEIAAPPDQQPSQPHRVLVVSGSTITQGGEGHREACRMIAVTAGSAAPAIDVERIAGVPSGQSLKPRPLGRHHLWRQPPPEEVERWQTTVVRGRTAAATYERLLEVIGDRRGQDRRLYNVVCHVVDGQSARTLPPHYPEIDSAETAEERQAWFEDVVKWWQHRRTIKEPLGSAARRVVFTHGDRIHGPSAPARDGREEAGEERSRLEVAIAALGPDFAASGRGIVPILDPTIDCVDADDRDFPAFCSVQFLLRADGGLKLDVVGYFRKQELVHWWPVNMAELAVLQEQALNDLPVDQIGGVEPGCLTTVAALAHAAGTTAPRVAVPVIDRLHDEEKDHELDRDRLWDLAYGLVSEPGDRRPDAQSWRSCWDTVLADLRPKAKFTAPAPPVALEGLAALVRRLRVLARYNSGPVVTIYQQLQAVRDLNTAYAEAPSRQKHTSWRGRVGDHLDEVTRALNELDPPE
jgi:hypothetical protein